jgi:microcystin-dependent protein
MAQKTITELQLASEFDDTSNVAMDDGVQSYRSTGLQIKNYILPAGSLLPFAGSSAPDGFLLCDGSAVSRSTYSALFSAIGEAYGVGDGSTTFNLPDLRGRIPVGKDDMGGAAASRLTSAGSGVDGSTLGADGGAETHQLTEDEMPSHTHTQNAHTHTQNAHAHTAKIPSSGFSNAYNVNYVGGSNIGGYNGSAINSATATNQNTTATNQDTGNDDEHNNVQPSLVVNYLIRY